MLVGQAVVAQAFNPIPWEAEAGLELKSSACVRLQVLGLMECLY